MDKQEISDFVLGELRANFPLFEEEHDLMVRLTEKGAIIHYNTVEEDLSTHFDIEVRGELGYLDSMNIDEDKRGQGYGTKLYQVIETVFRKYGCKKLILSPSGYEKYFWETVGFENGNRILAEKRLT